MKTAEIQVGTEYVTKMGRMIPTTKCSWKAGSFDGARRTDGSWEQERYGDWVPVTGVHASQIVETVEQREARDKARAIDAEVARVARAQREKLEAEEINDRFGQVIADATETFGYATVRESYDFRAEGEVYELRTGYVDYSVAATYFVDIAKRLGRNCSEMPRSTAMVEALCAVAAGFAPEPTGHTTDLVFKGDDEIAAFAAVLGEA